jgi:cytochrome b
MLQTSPSSAAGPGRAIPSPLPKGRLVSDAPTRMFHWLFALSFVGAWLTAESEHWRAMHVTLGYGMAGLLAFRIFYGLVGPRHARLGLLWRKLTGASTWARSLRTAFEGGGPVNWRQGQNLLGAAAVATLLLIVVPVTLTGYLTYQDWGGEWLEEAHEIFANVFLTAVIVHLALILGLSVLRRQNKALPMLTGRIPGAGPDLVKKARRPLAAALLVTLVGFGAWQWHEAPAGLLPAGDAATERSDGAGGRALLSDHQRGST